MKPYFSWSSALTHNRTECAWYTSISIFIQHCASLLAVLFVTPIILKGLGTELYGCWIIILQLVGYLTIADLHPLNALRLNLATQKHLDNIESKQRQVGAAILAGFFLFPLFLLLGGMILWLSPAILRIDSIYLSNIRWAIAIATFTIAIGGLFQIPNMILKSMNVEYVDLWPNLLMIAAIATMDILVIQLGFGLPGLAISKLIGATLIFIIRSIAVKKIIPWFGIHIPTLKELKQLLSYSGWLSLNSFTFVLDQSTYLILIGAILNPSLAAIYALTFALPRMLGQPIISILPAIGPGFGDLFGRNELSKLRSLWKELSILLFGLMIILSAISLSLNSSFVPLWVGEDLFAGNLLTPLLVLLICQTFLSQLNSTFMTACLSVKQQSIFYLIGSLSALLLGILMMLQWGLIGMAAGMALGRMVMVVGYPILLSRVLKTTVKEYWYEMSRPVITLLIIGIISYSVGSSFLNITSWGEIFIWGIGILILAIVIVWLLAFSPTWRKTLFKRLPFQTGTPKQE